MSKELSISANSTVQCIMDGGKPTPQELAELAPKLKMVESAIKACKDHIKERLQDGESIEGAKLCNGRTTYSIDARAAFQLLQEHFGDNLDRDEWVASLSIGKPAVEKVIAKSGGNKKEVQDILGAAMTAKTGSPWLKI